MGTQDGWLFSGWTPFDKAIQKVNVAKYSSGFYQFGVVRKIKVIFRTKYKVTHQLLS